MLPVSSKRASHRRLYRLLLRHGYVVVLLKGVINNESGLSSHRVVNGEDARAVWDRLHDRLQAVLELMVVKARAWTDGRLVLLPDRSSEAQTTELLGCSLNTEELLLKSSLLLCKIRIGGKQFIVQVLVHVLASFSINLNLGRCKDMFWKRVHVPTRDGVAALCMTWEIGSSCGLRDPLVWLWISIFAAL